MEIKDIKETLRNLQAYIPQEREAINNDERKLGIRKLDFNNTLKLLESLIKADHMEEIKPLE
jgi:hypothetical protein